MVLVDRLIAYSRLYSIKKAKDTRNVFRKMLMSSAHIKTLSLF